MESREELLANQDEINSLLGQSITDEDEESLLREIDGFIVDVPEGDLVIPEAPTHLPEPVLPAVPTHVPEVPDAPDVIKDAAPQAIPA